jgi:hypothetical protein
MKVKLLGFLFAVNLISAVCATADTVTVGAPKTDQERIDSLIRENQMLTEMISGLKLESERPKTKEEAFVACMQAAKGSPSAMAAESIGGHCDQLLRI